MSAILIITVENPNLTWIGTSLSELPHPGIKEERYKQRRVRVTIDFILIYSKQI
jgi:hypothetical protein